MTEKTFKGRASHLTDGEQLAIIMCANSFRFGGHWGFIRNTKKEFTEVVNSLKDEKPNVKLISVSNGVLILADTNFLAVNVNKLVPNAINGSFAERAKKCLEEEREKFSKFIKNVVSGKSSHLKKEKGYYELKLGIYSINHTNAIRLNGEDYPAYKLTMIEALDMAHKLEASGMQVYVRALDENKKEVFDRVFHLAGNSKGQSAILRGLEISETDTGVFITFRVVPSK